MFAASPKDGDKFHPKSQMLFLDIAFSHKCNLVLIDRGKILVFSILHSLRQNICSAKCIPISYLILFPFLVSLLFHSSTAPCLENHSVYLYFIESN